MLPAVLIGAGIAALLIKAFSEDEEPKSKNDKKKLFIFSLFLCSKASY